jgi:hypothetical protein
MPYVVKVTSPGGFVDWICRMKFADARVFGKRESAEMFTTKLEAHTAIDSLPSVLASVGVSFSVEVAD